MNVAKMNQRELTKAVIEAQGYKVYERLDDMPMRERVVGVQTPYVFWWNPGDKSYLYKTARDGYILSYEPTKSWEIAGKFLTEMTTHDKFFSCITGSGADCFAYMLDTDGDDLHSWTGPVTPEVICRVYVAFKQWEAAQPKEDDHE